jgi:hypothetical protein
VIDGSHERQNNKLRKRQTEVKHHERQTDNKRMRRYGHIVPFEFVAVVCVVFDPDLCHGL